MAHAAILYFQVMWIWHSGMLIVWCLSFVPNLVQISVIVTEIDVLMLQTFNLMTSRELTSGFDCWSRGYLRMAVSHLSKNLVNKSISKLELLKFYRNSRWRPPPSWIFKVCKIGTFRCVDSVVLELCTKFGSNICYGHWDRRTYAPDSRRSFDDVTRINFRFRLLVTWTSPHGHDASSHHLWCRSVA